MASDLNTKNFEFKSDVLESYVDSGVGVIYFKDKVFEMSLDFALQSMLFDRLKIAAGSDEIKVLLLMSAESAVGEKKSFEFFKKLKDSLDGKEVEDFRADIDPSLALSRIDSTLNQYITAIIRYNKFIVSAVRGSVITEFLGTILAGDYRIAGENTVFSFPHFKYGLPPRGAVSFLLPKYTGLSAAKEILLQGKPIDANRARELNIVDEVIPNDSFEERCLEIAKKFTGLPSNIIAMTKELLFSNIKELEDYFKLESGLTNIYQVKLPPEPED
jgi:enoyl-CoA hydratase/carnithine racemase